MIQFNTRGLAAAAMIATGLTSLAAPAFAMTPFGAVAAVYGPGATLSNGGAGSTEAVYNYDSYYQDTGYGHTEHAAASLSDGKLHASSIVTWPSCDSGVCPSAGGVAHAAMWDTVTFTGVEGEPLEIIGLIPTYLEIDGHLGANGYNRAMYRTYFGSDPNYDASDMPWEELGDGTRESLDNLFIPLGSGPMYVYFELWVSTTTSSGNAISDFGNTMSFGWELPEGVVAHSASGAFLTGAASAVPEPDAWALMILGFGLAGCALRRRSTAPLCV